MHHISDRQYTHPGSSIGVNCVLDTVEPLSLHQWDERSYANGFLLEELFPEDEVHTLYREKDVDTTLVAVVSLDLRDSDTLLTVARQIYSRGSHGEIQMVAMQR